MDSNQNFSTKSMKPFFILIAFAVLLFWALENIKFLTSILSAGFSIFAPFILGSCIAFILNVPMKKIEKFIFPKPNKKQMKFKRPVSLILTLLLFVFVIAVVFGLVIPELSNSFTTLTDSVVQFLQIFEQQHPAFLDEFAEYLPSSQELANINWEEVAQKLFSVIGSGAGSLINTTVNAASRIFSAVLTFFIAFVFSIYILLQKENLGRQFKKLIYAFIPKAKADYFFYIANLSNKTFSNFLSGQCTEAVILGTVFFIAMTIFRFPYALMVSVLISVTALIPIFGAFIGCFVGAFMILMTDGFIKTIWFIVMFLILQQLEGNLIYPKVVGNSVGLPSIWVFAAVSIGGSAFGVVGMLVFIPLCSVLYSLLRESVNRRIKSKQIKI